MIRLAIRVRREHAEVALAELLELVPAGVEEVDLGDGAIEYAVYGAPGELPTLPDLEAAAGPALVEVSTSELADDWPERWRSFHRPLVLQGRLAVRPPWDDPTDAPIDVVIEPGRAFGTGSHATTRLCLELMLSLARPIGPLLDLGCGSGVLAIAAARLGFDPVTAVDNDPLALDAAAQNAARNGVQIEVRRCDLRASELAATGTVVANLLRPLLIEVASKLVGPPACLIASGLLGHEAKGVAEAFARSGLSETARRSQGEWTALLLERG